MNFLRKLYLQNVHVLLFSTLPSVNPVGQRQGTTSQRTKPALHLLVERLEHKFKPSTPVSSMAKRQTPWQGQNEAPLQSWETNHKTQTQKKSDVSRWAFFSCSLKPQLAKPSILESIKPTTNISDSKKAKEWLTTGTAGWRAGAAHQRSHSHNYQSQTNSLPYP